MHANKQFLDVDFKVPTSGLKIGKGIEKHMKHHVKKYVYVTTILQVVTTSLVLMTFLTILTFGILILKKKS